MIRIMDIIDSTSRQQQRGIPDLGLDAARDFFAVPSVLNVASKFFEWAMRKVLRDQKLKILSKFTLHFRRFNCSKAIQEIMDFRELAFNQHIFRIIEVLCYSTYENVTEASRLLRRLKELERQWGMIKETLDVAAIVDKWRTVPVFKGFDIHYTKLGRWTEEEWDFFDKLIAEYGLKIVKYKVGSWNQRNEPVVKKRGKSKHKSRTRPNVLFNKYEIQQFAKQK